MTIFLPPSTNNQYRGSRYAAWGLTLYAIGWIIPGMIHSFPMAARAQSRG